MEVFVRYLAINLLQGSATFFFLLSVYQDIPNAWGYALAYIAAYPVGRLVGQIATVAPGGLGVREGVYALLISAYVPVQAAVLGAPAGLVVLGRCQRGRGRVPRKGLRYCGSRRPAYAGDRTAGGAAATFNALFRRS